MQEGWLCSKISLITSLGRKLAHLSALKVAAPFVRLFVFAACNQGGLGVYCIIMSVGPGCHLQIGSDPPASQTVTDRVVGNCSQRTNTPGSSPPLVDAQKTLKLDF